MLTTEPDPGIMPGTTTTTTGVTTTPIAIQIPMATIAPLWQLHGTLPILFKCITGALGGISHLPKRKLLLMAVLLRWVTVAQPTEETTVLPTGPLIQGTMWKLLITPVLEPRWEEEHHPEMKQVGLWHHSLACLPLVLPLPVGLSVSYNSHLLLLKLNWTLMPILVAWERTALSSMTQNKLFLLNPLTRHLVLI